MLIGVIADDFTGAGDIASTLAQGLPDQGGLRTAQFLGTPRFAAPDHIEAGVIALKTRTCAPDQAVRESLAALEWLRAQGCRQIVFKYCSTFDSTPDGNIGPVAEALSRALAAGPIPVCPAFPEAGRTMYKGHLFVNGRLLNESGMQNHPLTPMTDPDICRWLGRQTDLPTALIDADIVRKGTQALASALQKFSSDNPTLVVIDALSNADLVAIATAAADLPLLTGGSGIAIGLPGNFINHGFAKGSIPQARRIRGTEAILAGSCSTTTLNQISVHTLNHPTLELSVDSVMSKNTTADHIVRFITEHQGQGPLVYSSGTPEAVTASQEAHGRAEVAAQLDRLFAEAASELVARGTKRIVVAGGETSGAVVQALSLGALEIGPQIAPGVPILYGANDDIGIALKSGNFGAPDFFETALAMIAGEG